MSKSLSSILLQRDGWSFDIEGRSIKFNEDGTGELWCRCNFNYWIAAELHWEIITATTNELNTPIKTRRNQPHILGHLELEIRLTNTLPTRVETSILAASTLVNGHSLTDEAYLPRRYHVRIEQGNFIEPCMLADSGPRFSLRLVFDQSPYPPRSMWKNAWYGPDECRFWDHKQFVAGSAHHVGRAMNDPNPPGWTCVVS